MKDFQACLNEVLPVSSRRCLSVPGRCCRVMMIVGMWEEMTVIFMPLSGERHHRVAASVTVKVEEATDGRREFVCWRELLYLLSG